MSTRVRAARLVDDVEGPRTIGQFPVHMHAVSKWSMVWNTNNARNLNMMDLKDSIENAFLVGRLVQKFLFLILNGNSVKVVDQDPVRAHASAEYKHL